MADLSQALARVDEIIEREPDGNLAYEEMKQIYDSDESTHENVEVMWRLCKATFLKSNTLDKKNPTKKKLLLEARSYGIKAYALDEDNYEALKWEAICVGSMTDFLGIKDKIEQGFIFKVSNV
ncbi:hypothetical protein AB6A40_011410 [Gnathostoma spinigerum]|uniref:Uncharacterized protein n=1 Tax=Gnathostoma spinigerum TaxID=75299 RepID=A0ABD6F2X4_9BILA